MEGDLPRVKNALAATGEAIEVAEEARSKTESEAIELEVDRTSLLLKLGTVKDEVFSPCKDKEYHKDLEVIFAYGYGCCIFKHNIYGDRPEVPQGMPDSADPLPLEFFDNPGCPLVQPAAEATKIKVPLNEATKEPVEIVIAKDHGRL